MTNPENTNSDSHARSVDIPGSPAYMNRGPMPAGAGPARMPGMGYGYPAYTVPGQNQEAVGRKLVIGEGITMSGEIEACEHLVVEGTARLALKGANVLDIAQSGAFFGAVEISEATIAGRFEGDLTVNGRLTVRATGAISGSVSYRELAIEAGALIDGKINPLREKGAAGAQQSKKQQQQRNADSSRPAQEQTTGHELPFAGSAQAAE